jgi:hypothetical protein
MTLDPLEGYLCYRQFVVYGYPAFFRNLHTVIVAYFTAKVNAKRTVSCTSQPDERILHSISYRARNYGMPWPAYEPISY